MSSSPFLQHCLTYLNFSGSLKSLLLLHFTILPSFTECFKNGANWV
ncbi:MAG: hypothetical protein IJR44_04215 [Neisseriaceae bacterium]|nr:hypothetical protein [Neisseriaceae bacterium]